MANPVIKTKIYLEGDGPEQGDQYIFYDENSRKDLNNKQGTTYNYQTYYATQNDINNIVGGQYTQFPVYTYLFQKMPYVWTVGDVINWEKIILRMKTYCEPIYQQFTDIKENKAFKRIKYMYFEYLYFNNTLWLWYDRLEQEFRLFIKVDPLNEFDGKVIDIETGEMTFVAVPQELIQCWWNGIKFANRLLQWACVARDHETRLHMLRTMDHSWHKHFLAQQFTEQTQEAMDMNREKFYNMDIFYDVNNVGNSIKLMEGKEAVELAEFATYSYDLLDRESAELGKITNINHKQERKTSGENSNDVHANIARQNVVLEEQSRIFELVRELFQQDIEIVVKNQLTEDNMIVEGENVKPNKYQEPQINKNF